MIRRVLEFDDTEDLGRDPELAAALYVLDPASEDANYWHKFRWWVVGNAAAELARRKMAARLTIGEVLESWARTLLPTAAVLAALAGFLMLRGEPSGEGPPIAVEELLLSEVEGQAVPLDFAGMAFAAEIF